MVISFDTDGRSSNGTHGKESFQVAGEEIPERNNVI